MSYYKKCTIRILDEVSCVFVGLHPDHIAYFYEEYAMYAPNYYFNPKFKLGSWDGKVRFFHKTGKTYVNLLDDIVPRIIGLGYKVKIVDLRSSKPIFPDLIDKDYLSYVDDPFYDKPWEMRSYQVAMVNALLEYGSGVGICGTGGGKTSMCVALAKRYEETADLRSIIIVPDKQLTAQTKDNYAYFEIDVGEYSGTRKDFQHQHVVSTWQALRNNPDMVQNFQVIIVDECHGIKGNVLTELLNEHGKYIPYRFGVTGTLPKEPTDAMAVKIAVGEVRYTIPAHVLIEQGHLAELHIDIIQHEINLKEQYEQFKEEYPNHKTITTYTKFKDSYFPDWSAEKRFLQSEKDRLEWISMFIEAKRDLGKGNVLCLVGSVNFGKKLTKMIEGAHFVYGKDVVKERRKVYDLFKNNNNLVVVATVHIARQGLDIPRIFNLMFIDMGRSFIRTIQTIGRGLRRAPDKDFVYVTDICSDLKYSKRHVRERTKFYKEARYPHKKRIVDYTE